MDPEIFAKVTLSGFAIVAVTTLLVQAIRWPGGWSVWLLSMANRLYVRTCFLVRRNRPCPFPQEGPAIIIANHRSPVDPLFVWLGQRRIINFMMAREYYEKGFLRWLCVLLESIPVSRNGRDLGPAREALRRLKAGKLLGIFPEGGLNVEKDLMPGIPGMAWLALRSQAPVFPVYIHNSPLGRTMVEPFYNFRQVRITYGEPIDLSEYYKLKPSQEILTEVTNLMMSRIAELGGIGYTPYEHSENGNTENGHVQNGDA